MPSHFKTLRALRAAGHLAAPIIVLALSVPALAQTDAPPPAPAAPPPAPAAPPPAPITSGYDKGFFIRGENFEIRLGARVQLLGSSTAPDTFIYDSLLGSQEDIENDNELTIRRFKLYATGFAFKPSIKWKFQLDMERFKPGGGSSGNIRLEEAFMDLTDRPWTQLRLGQFKVPYGYEKMTSSGRLNLVDRSIVHAFFGVNQEPGINLFGQSFGRKFRYDVALTTGVADNVGYSTRNDIDAGGKSDFRYMARVTWEPLSPYTWEQGAVSAPERAELTLQLGVMTNQTTVPQDADPFLPTNRVVPFGQAVLGAPSATFPAATETTLNLWTGVSQSRKAYDRNEAEFVGAFKLKRFAIETQAIVGNVDPDLRYLKGKDPSLDELEFDNLGYRIQPGFMLIPTRLEIAGRWAVVEREAKVELVGAPSIKEEIDMTEWRLGLNWYFSKHDLKWQFDVGQIGTEWKLDGARLEVPDRSDFPGGVGFDDKVIQRNVRTDSEFRTQLQFQF